MTGIQWTDETWNPTTGCSKVSPGCKNCYAERMHARLTAMGQAKYSRPFEEVVFHDDALTLPLRWREPRRIFVDSMSDLFHEDAPHEKTAAVYGVACICPQHTFQIVTKRPENAAIWHDWAEHYAPDDGGTGPARAMFEGICCSSVSFPESYDIDGPPLADEWPPKNVHLLTSCENQRYAEERIRWLFKCPAAVRGVSLEPLLGPIDLTNLSVNTPTGVEQWDALRAEYDDELGGPGPKLDWVIVGCESGPRRRPCDIQWILDLVRQCRAAGVPIFVKQIEVADGRGKTRVSKDPNECGGWPKWAVRMFPGERWS